MKRTSEPQSVATTQQHAESHPAPQRFECPHCNKTYTRKGILNAHIATHTGLKPHKCSVCGAEFIRSNDMRVHFRAKHGKTEPFICQDWEAEWVQPRDKDTDKTAPQENELGSAQQLQDSKVFYMLVGCGSKFGRKSTLLRHQRVAPHDAICSIWTEGFKKHQGCNARFSSVENLLKHRQEDPHSGLWAEPLKDLPDQMANDLRAEELISKPFRDAESREKRYRDLNDRLMTEVQEEVSSRANPSSIMFDQHGW
jgi:hypothetical protein